MLSEKAKLYKAKGSIVLACLYGLLLSCVSIDIRRLLGNHLRDRSEVMRIG